MAATAKKVIADLQIREALLEDIHESPTNTRRTWGNLEELAASLKATGQLQPGLARPSGREPGAFELVFGHRRFRALRLSGALTMQLVVRDMSEEEVLEAQAIENLQREDLHELEEAESYEQLRKIGKKPEQIAAQIGKSRSYVFQRMKLLDLGPEAREAFYAGELTPSVALFVARVPVVLQVKALEELRTQAKENALDFGDAVEDKHGNVDPATVDPLTAREASRLLRDRFTLKLATAPFDRGDAELVPGVGSCKDCPKRSGNQSELFADVDTDDVCTDPPCFEEKKRAAATETIAKLEKKGVEVLAGELTEFGGRVKPPKGFVKLDEYCPETGKTYGEMAKGKRVAAKLGGGPRAVVLDERNKPVDVVRKADVLEAAGVEKERTPRQQSHGPTPAQMMRIDAERLGHAAAMGALVGAVEKAGALSDALIRSLIRGGGYRVQEVAARRGWPEKKGFRPNYDDQIAKLRGPALLGRFVEIESVDLREGFPAACASMKVDVKTHVAAALAKLKEEAKKPAPAAAADPKPSAKKGKGSPKKVPSKKRAAAKSKGKKK
jgi:ParB/RepB/Spo0J family partition protein